MNDGIKIWYVHILKYYSSIKAILSLETSMGDEPEGDYAKQNKSERDKYQVWNINKAIQEIQTQQNIEGVWHQKSDYQRERELEGMGTRRTV